MKRLSYVLVALLGLCGCSKENNQTSAPEKGLRTFTVSAEIVSDQGVKANLDEQTLEVLWQKGDKIGLVGTDGKITPALLDEEYAGRSTGVFRYQALSPVSVEYAFYPYTGDQTCTDGVLSISIPQTQTYVSEGFVAANTLVMAGKYTDAGLVFKNACSIVQLNITGVENYLRNVYFISSGADLVGKGTIDLKADAPVFVADDSSESGHFVNLDLGGTRLYSDATQKATVYLVMAPGTYDALSVYTIGNSRQDSTDPATDVALVYSSSKSVTLNPGRIRPLNVVMKMPENTTVYGRVCCEDSPVGGVAVTDGIEVTTTDEDGYYYLNSTKPHGMVYLSIPSGYTVKRGYGAVPQFYKYTAKPSYECERIDFELLYDGDQTNHTMLLIGDIHLMGKSNTGNESNNNLTQFRTLVDEVNEYVAQNRDSKIYAMTLGDMTWDSYWIWNKFKIPDYLQHSDRFNMNVFTTVGNHDNDCTISSDWECMAEWRKYYGPTYYSLNIGDVHYISLDNVITKNGGTIDTRGYNFGLTDQALTWLKKDLALVDKSTPIVVTMHIPLLNRKGKARSSAYGDMQAYQVIDTFKEYSDVTYFSAHTHTLYSNVNGSIDNPNTSQSQPVKEYNTGTGCADFWGSGAINSDLLISRDGSPGGYRIMKVQGKTKQVTYKVTGKSDHYMFRVYDRNSIHITADKYVPNAGPNHRAEYEKYLDEYASASSANKIYILVWDWHDGWNISIKEGSTSLSYYKCSDYLDPLYMISSMVTRCNKADSGAYTLDMTPVYMGNMFIARATSATSTVTITVTDPNGRSQTQVIKRPRPFNIVEYAYDGKASSQYMAPTFDLDTEMNL